LLEEHVLVALLQEIVPADAVVTGAKSISRGWATQCSCALEVYAQCRSCGTCFSRAVCVAACSPRDKVIEWFERQATTKHTHCSLRSPTALTSRQHAHLRFVWLRAH
jgi:hypothetical protein